MLNNNNICLLSTHTASRLHINYAVAFVDCPLEVFSMRMCKTPYFYFRSEI